MSDFSAKAFWEGHLAKRRNELLRITKLPHIEVLPGLVDHLENLAAAVDRLVKAMQTGTCNEAFVSRANAALGALVYQLQEDPRKHVSITLSVGFSAWFLSQRRPLWTARTTPVIRAVDTHPPTRLPPSTLLWIISHYPKPSDEPPTV